MIDVLCGIWEAFFMRKIWYMLMGMVIICLSAACGEQKNKQQSVSEDGGHLYDSVFPQHEPYGAGIGAMPGRVVWNYDTDSVLWDGEGFWWQPENFDESVIQSMVNDSIASLGGKETVGDGWNALFQAHNTARGKGSASYAAGEKIAIKANINGSGVFDDDTSGETQMSYTNPVLLKTLLISLVEEAGISPSDITVYDVSRLFPDYMVEMCTEGRLTGIK